jgi:polysaccharide export outer membrane protein
MTIKKTRNINIAHLFIVLLLMVSCSIAPGMHMESNKSWFNNEEFVYIESLDRNLTITPINEYPFKKKGYDSYKIGIGDQISVTVWGLPDIFPIINITPDQNLRRVDQNGNIFFPYAGLLNADGKTQDQLRDDLTISLSENFNDPQIDVTISRFNSQQVFVLGEVNKPTKINITDVPLSLSDAIGNSLGLRTNTAGKDVFIIRHKDFDNEPKIYYTNLSSPSYFIDSGNFYLMDNDIVYINSSSTTRWNKVVSQFFPFSSFLNTVDNITKD